MGMNFPNSPVPGQVFTPVGGYSYVFLDGVWRIVQDAQSILTADTRNRIVNGAMQISQDSAFDVYVTTSSSYPADQWVAVWATSGVPRVTGVATEPEGKFITFNSWTTVDAAVAAGDLAYIAQRIEGINIADFGWGTAAAKPVVLRFTARCATVASLVIGVSLRTNSGSRSFIKNITLTSAWQDFVIPVPGDTGGAWPTDTSAGILLTFAAMAGSTYIGASEGAWLATNSMAAAGVGNVMAVASSRMDIKNVGLYLDPLATGVPPRWQMPDEADELRACQRYFTKFFDGTGNNAGAAFHYGIAGGAYYAYHVDFPVFMRAVPAVSGSTHTYTNCSAGAFISDFNSTVMRVTVTGSGGYRAIQPGILFANARM